MCIPSERSPEGQPSLHPSCGSAGRKGKKASCIGWNLIPLSGLALEGHTDRQAGRLAGKDRDQDVHFCGWPPTLLPRRATSLGLLPREGCESGREGGPCGLLYLTMTSVSLPGRLFCAPDLGCFSRSKASCALPPSGLPCPWPSASSPRCPRSVTPTFRSLEGGGKGRLLWKGPRAPLSSLG